LLADANARHLIREFTRVHPDGSEQLLEVDWNWIVGEEDCVASVLVTLRDVTLVRGLAHQVARAEREARIVAQILSAGLSEFSTFCEAARRWLNRDRERLMDPVVLAAAELPGLFRSVHTIKGSARALGFAELADAAHAAEDGLARLRQRDDGPNRSAALDASSRLAQLLDDHERTGREKLAPLWAQHDSGLRQAMEAVEAALSRTVDGTLQPLQLVSELEQIVQRQHVIPLEQLLEKTCRSLPSLAQELGRPPPELDFQARGWTLADDWAAPLEQALTHAFRNALDHGIEPVEQRLLAGKQPRGWLLLRVAPGELSVQLRLSDDGRGLALDQLRERAAHPSLSDAELAEAVFAFGVSSAAEVSSISGRGVGLDALRSELRQRGGDAFIEFTGSAHDGYRPFQLVLRLPSSAFAALRR
jgi:chemotaxis protein histidine kinase CheA